MPESSSCSSWRPHERQAWVITLGGDGLFYLCAAALLGRVLDLRAAPPRRRLAMVHLTGDSAHEVVRCLRHFGWEVIQHHQLDASAGFGPGKAIGQEWLGRAVMVNRHLWLHQLATTHPCLRTVASIDLDMLPLGNLNAHAIFASIDDGKGKPFADLAATSDSGGRRGSRETAFLSTSLHGGIMVIRPSRQIEKNLPPLLRAFGMYATQRTYTAGHHLEIDGTDQGMFNILFHLSNRLSGI
jgi:hypothetical protein